MIAGVYFRLEDKSAGMNFLEKAVGLGQGGLKLFFKIFPEGQKNPKIQALIK